MRITKIGFIEEKIVLDQKGLKVKKYVVKMIGTSSREFDNKFDALKFAKTIAANFLNQGEVEKISIKFTYKNKISHYIIIKVDPLEEEPIVYEQTEFEYMRTYRYEFPRYARRKIIDDRNYSFLDILRASINWSPRYNIFLIATAAIGLLFSLILLIKGLDYVLEENASFQFSIVWVQEYFLFLPFAINIIYLIYVGLKTFFSYRQIAESTGDYQEIDWSAWARRKILFLTLTFLFAILAMGCLIIFALEFNHLASTFFYAMIIVCLTLWSIIMALQMFIAIKSYIDFLASFRKYYPRVRSRTFWKWFRDSTLDDHRKINTNYFIFNPIDSELLSRKNIQSSRLILQKMDRSELKVYRREVKIKNREAIDNYLTSTKGVKHE